MSLHDISDILHPKFIFNLSLISHEFTLYTGISYERNLLQDNKCDCNVILSLYYHLFHCCLFAKGLQQLPYCKKYVL